jgi:DNA-binding transcriptional LysR family regulator
MGQMEDFRLFARVVETGSISKAANSLNIAKSAVSRRLGLLEQRFDTTLIDRAPGAWTLTATGRELYIRVSRIVEDAEEIDNDFLNRASSLSGPLSVSVPRDFGLNFLGAALLSFRERHPEIRLTIDFDDRLVDLGRENYDFAIRIADVAQGDLAATTIGTAHHRLVASPAYLVANPEPQAYGDLPDHRLLCYGTAHRASWDLISPSGRRVIVDFQPYLNSNSGVFLLEAARNGMGIAKLPDFLSVGALADGTLVPVLPEIAVPDSAICLVHAENRRLNRRMRIFIDEMAHACAALAL